MKKSFPIHFSACSNIQTNVKVLLFYFMSGASVFPKVFYFRKMIMKMGCILDCFCISLVVVSFITLGNKSKPAEVSFHLQAEY